MGSRNGAVETVVRGVAVAVPVGRNYPEEGESSAARMSIAGWGGVCARWYGQIRSLLKSRRRTENRLVRVRVLMNVLRTRRSWKYLYIE